MARLSITSANAVYMLAVLGVFPAPVQLQGFGVDEAFDTEAVDAAEAVMGVDGKMSAGYTPFLTPQTITLQADSPSSFLFEDWLAAQKAVNDVLFADGTILLPSIGRSYTMTKGVLSRIPQVVGAKKVLQARQFRITWESVTPAPVL